MKIRHALHRSRLRLKEWSPTIVTGIGAAGVIFTTVTAVRATPKALELIEREKREFGNRELTKLEVVKTAWTCYIPTVASGIATIACIFGANAMNQRRQAAMTSAYIFLDQSFREYRSKAKEMLGDDGEHEIRTELAKDVYKNSDITPMGEKLLFYVQYHDDFFERTMLEVRDAEYQLNRKFATEGDVCLNDFFELLGLEKNAMGEFFGWSPETHYENYRCPWIEFEHNLTVLDDGLECYIIEMPCEPKAGYLPF